MRRRRRRRIDPIVISFFLFSLSLEEEKEEDSFDGKRKEDYDWLMNNWKGGEFWIRILARSLTCLSVRSRDAAISILRGLHRYLLKWNSFSSSSNCVFV